MALYDQFQWAPGEGIQSVGSFDVQQANAADTWAKQAQQVAETKDYTSQAAQEMRQSGYLAKAAESQLQGFVSDTTKNYYLSNPGLLEKSIGTNVQAKISDELSKMSDNNINYAGNTFGNAIDKKTGALNLDNYETYFDQVQRENPDIIKTLGMPSPDAIRADPTGKLLKTAQMLSVHANETREESFKDKELQAQLNEKSEMGLFKMQTMLQVQQSIAQWQNNRSQLRYQQGVDVATIRAQAQAKNSAIRDSAIAAGQFPQARSYGTITEQGKALAGEVEDYASQIGLNLDPETEKGLVYNGLQAGTYKYNQELAQAIQDKKDNKPYTLPRPPTETAMDIVKQIASDPEKLKKAAKGFVFTTDQMDTKDMGSSVESKPITSSKNTPTTPTATTPATPSISKEQSSLLDQYEDRVMHRGSLPGDADVAPKGTRTGREIYNSALTKAFNPTQLAAMKEPGFSGLSRTDKETILTQLSQIK